MEVALPRLASSEWSDDVRALGNWLLCWLLLPNVSYWLLWLIGGAPRPQAILITGLIGIVLHRAPFALKYGGFLVAMTISLFFFVSTLFNLSILSLLHAVQFATELRPTASIEYVVSGAVAAATAVVAFRLLRRSTRLHAPRWFAIAASLIVVAASADLAIAERGRGAYARVPDSSIPFTSAVTRSGLAGLATGERHVLIVMVEAMGQPVEPALRRRLLDLWARPEVRARYDVLAGDTPFYGSTTSGEMRELCGRWSDYSAAMENDQPDCLPARLTRRGYQTSAWHSFTGTMFDRTSWYPHIGFGEMRFAADLQQAGAETCPGVFPGACDRDVPRQIGVALKQARQPQFLYWLTVNSHLPVLRSEILQTDDCASFDATLDIDYPQTCRLLQLFDQTGRALAHEITAADFPPTDILIVGDHLPPFFDRQHREQYEPDRVPWVLLRPRTGRAPAADTAAAPGTPSPVRS